MIKKCRPSGGWDDKYNYFCRVIPLKGIYAWKNILAAIRFSAKMCGCSAPVHKKTCLRRRPVKKHKGTKHEGTTLPSGHDVNGCAAVLWMIMFSIQYTMKKSYWFVFRFSVSSVGENCPHCPSIRLTVQRQSPGKYLFPISLCMCRGSQAVGQGLMRM